MNYKQSLSYLNSFLNFERVTLSGGRTWNLDRMRFLLKAFGHPEKKIFTVLIAGTKGKGSTAFFVESLLRVAGYSTGLYSSPHLEDPRERIRLQGQMISKAEWAAGLQFIKRNIPKMPARLESPTYFEIMTLLAALVFQKKKVDAAIFEVGLGGRLDATNALDPKIILLTPIHRDHEDVLGHTLQKIAGEKAAVIRKNSQVLTAPQAPEAMREILKQIRRTGASLEKVTRPVSLPVGLEGDFQKVNAQLAAIAVNSMKFYGFKVSPEAVRKGLLYRSWPGRMEHMKGVLLDGAHNPASIEALVRNLKKHYGARKRLLIFGTSRDKKSEPMLKTLGSFFDTVILCRHASPRSQDPALLALQARPYFKKILLAESSAEAFEFASGLANSKALITVTGSFYLIGEARRILRHA